LFGGGDDGWGKGKKKERIRKVGHVEGVRVIGLRDYN